LATADQKGRPVLTRSAWPVMVKDAAHEDVPDALFMVSYAYREEKGSDVSVASHLLLDVLSGDADAAIVVSNDSDLRFPIQEARKRVPVGTVNPSRNWLAGDLAGSPADGAGGHWWRQLNARDFTTNQLPDPAGGYRSPPPAGRSDSGLRRWVCELSFDVYTIVGRVFFLLGRGQGHIGVPCCVEVVALTGHPRSFKGVPSSQRMSPPRCRPAM